MPSQFEYPNLASRFQFAAEQGNSRRVKLQHTLHLLKTWKTEKIQLKILDLPLCGEGQFRVNDSHEKNEVVLQASLNARTRTTSQRCFPHQPQPQRDSVIGVTLTRCFCQYRQRVILSRFSLNVPTRIEQPQVISIAMCTADIVTTSCRNISK
uniref:Uncharacterized protein n=1 Tax=Physcomitrium patens TaxID=3218 RepID=A0A2K1LBP5_PHYPA|nr:hypothetical protein PHYPA_001872 [Physcomitrium patens]